MPADCKHFVMGGIARAHWNDLLKTLTVLQAADADGTGTWERILTVEDPSRLAGAAGWRCGLPGLRPVTIDGVTYPHLYAAVAAGAGWRAGNTLYVDDGSEVSGPGWVKIWQWNPAVWQEIETDPLPGQDP